MPASTFGLTTMLANSWAQRSQSRSLKRFCFPNNKCFCARANLRGMGAAQGFRSESTALPLAGAPGSQNETELVVSEVADSETRSVKRVKLSSASCLSHSCAELNRKTKCCTARRVRRATQTHNKNSRGKAHFGAPG